jgi:hypothetical protein
MHFVKSSSVKLVGFSDSDWAEVMKKWWAPQVIALL